jgi:hypothetical protein
MVKAVAFDIDEGGRSASTRGAPGGFSARRFRPRSRRLSGALWTIGLLCGGRPQRALLRAGCVAIERDPADLLRRYDQSPLRG